jgi:sugar phosphate permease
MLWSLPVGIGTSLQQSAISTGMTPGYRLFLRITLPLALLNLINQASRTVLAIIGPVLAVEFALSASELGLLAACMLAAYAVVQLPVGLALDVLGPRRVQATLALVAAAGFAAFALSDGMPGLAFARAMIGIGVSAGLMAVLKANTEWFAPARVASITGIAMAVGALGSVLTTVPVQAALPALGWRGVCWVLCAISVVVAVWIFASVRDKPGSLAARGSRGQLGVMMAIYRSQRFWRYGPAVAMLSIPNFAYLGLWAGPWLRDVAGYDGQARANTLLLYTLSAMAGALLLGAATSRARARGYPSLILALCSTGLLAAQIGLALQPATVASVTALWALFAFFTAGAASGYVAVGQMFPPEQMGRVSTAVNTLTLVGGLLLQTAIGGILDLWPRTAAGGWDPQGYSAALIVSAAIQLFLLVRLYNPRTR